MDAQALMQTMAELKEEVQEIPKEMQILTDKSEGISQRADTLVTLFEDSAAQANEVFDQLTQALHDLHETGKTTADDMQAAIAPVEQSTETLKTTSEAGTQAVEHSKTDLVHAFDAFAKALQDGAHQLETTGNEL